MLAYTYISHGKFELIDKPKPELQSPCDAIATRNIGATKASVLGVFEPITAILVGTLMFGEPLTTNIVVGIGIAIVAVTFMILVTKR